ncbi:unnamed protein product, partial [Didymodactylos carnosus]
MNSPLDISKAPQSCNSSKMQEYTFDVRIHKTDGIFRVKVQLHSTINDIIIDLCKRNNINNPEEYYICFFDQIFNNNDTVQSTNIHQLSKIHNMKWYDVKLPELRMKAPSVLETVPHNDIHVVFTTPEQVKTNEVLSIQFPIEFNQIVPESIQSIGKQINEHLPNKTAANGLTIIPLPTFTRTLVDTVALTINLTIPLKSEDFNWQSILEYLASDLEIDKQDMVIIDARQGSVILEIALKAKISNYKEKLEKIGKKIQSFFVSESKTISYIKSLLPTAKEVQKIDIGFCENTTINHNDDNESLSPDDIDFYLQMNQRPTVIDQISWDYLLEKSREITARILNSFQECDVEYVISNAALVYESIDLGRLGKKAPSPHLLPL